MELMTVSAPTVDPRQQVLSPSTMRHGYRPGERVWVHCSGSWRPGIVLSASPKAVTVRYRPAESRGTGVDTLTAPSIAIRDEEDEFLDHLND
jgi:hypothetical protein